ncbi:HAD family hydrolase [Roseivivax sp. GX 12232]|uniref:sulfotransferase-like domain-containing protein n=1 Tax=Roseivivax sp. GX 12232 TaxID=2900547 RepID=UPI001E32AA73|nr:HAD family hydrolase [Roseivivax sp. GX 12232]MCE0504176.1 HAD family hydrolase [Roseivivax sp. GX 12232]
MRIAMWSGPRNLSTALMYAFAARGDCAAWDEPFYAAYLARTGLAHPMAEEIRAAGLFDPAEVAAALRADPPEGRAHVYQKHMCQHMIAGMPRDWMADVTNVFLIRHPARVLASFASKYEAAGLEDIGFLQQAELFDEVAEREGKAPIVIDSNDIRDAPEAMLRALCAALKIEFHQEMLRWPAGPKPYDGVWAPVWYKAVHGSTGFAGREGPLPELSGAYAATAEAALPAYEKLKAHRLRAG